MRIKYIIPVPLDESGIANRAQQIQRDILFPDTEVECVPVRNSGTLLDSPYESLLFDMYCAEAALRAEEEGYDAVCLDTVSDSGLAAIRSRLTIPAVGPGLVAFHIALILGKKFSIVTMWDKWNHFYEKNLALYHLEDHCASIRSIAMEPDVEVLLGGKEEIVFPKLVEAGRKAIDEDGAGVLVLGSTTMHQAAKYMSENLPAPVINPGPVAIKIAEALVLLGLSHSKADFASPATIQDEKFFSLASTGQEPVPGRLS